MSNFISDSDPTADLPAAKTDLTTLPGGADSTKYVRATDINKLRTALIDIHTWVRGGSANWFATATNNTDPAPSAIDSYVYATDTDLFWKNSEGDKHILNSTYVDVRVFGAVPDCTKASGTITTLAVASIADGKYVDIPSGDYTQRFVFKKANHTINAGEVEVDLSALTTAREVAYALIDAIEGIYNKAKVNAFYTGTNTVTVRSNAIGAAGNGTITSDVLTVSGMTGGADGTDNLAAIMAAYAAAPVGADGYKEIYFPRGAGDYRIATSTTDLSKSLAMHGRLRFVGDGRGGSAIAVGSDEDNPNEHLVEGVAVGFLFGNAVGDTDVEMENLTIRGPTGNWNADHYLTGGCKVSTTGINFGAGFGRNRLKLTNVTILNFNNANLKIDPSQDGSCRADLIGCHFDSPSICVKLNEGVVPGASQFYATTGCTFRNQDSEANDLAKGHPFYIGAGCDFSFKSCQFLGTTYAAAGYNFSVFGGSVVGRFQTIEDCLFTGPAQVHLGVGATTRATVKNCTFDCTKVVVGCYADTGGVDFSDCWVVGDSDKTNFFVQNGIGHAPGPLTWRGGGFSGTFSAGVFSRANTGSEPWVIDGAVFDHSEGFFYYNTTVNTNVLFKRCRFTANVVGDGFNSGSCTGGTITFEDCSGPAYPVYVNGSSGTIKLRWKNNTGASYQIGAARGVELDADDMSALLTTSDGGSQTQIHYYNTPFGVTNYRVRAVAQRTDVTTKAAVFEYTAGVRNDAGTANLIGASPIAVMAESDEAVTCVVGVATSYLTVTVTGIAAKTYKWKIKIDVLGVC